MNRVLLVATVLGIIACQTPTKPLYKSYNEKINLNDVKMITKSEAKPAEEGKKNPLNLDPWIQIEQSENKIPYIQMDLLFEDSGLNIIEEIIEGTIIEHHIIVLNHKGEIIAKQPVNFQAYEIAETKTEVVRNKVILGESKQPIKVNSLVPETSVTREAQERQYTDKESVPQVLILNENKIPNPGEFVSVFLELTYINPHFEENCDPSSKACDQRRKSFFEDIAKRNRTELDNLKISYVNGNITNFPSLSSEELTRYKRLIQERISRQGGFLNRESSSPKYFYREWNLVSAPRYFKVQSIVKNGKTISTVEPVKTEPEPIVEKDKKIAEEPESIFENPKHSIHKKRTIVTP